MKKSLRFSSLLLALLLILTLPAGAYSAQSLVPQARTYTGSFTDISGLWCEDAVVTCYESGLLSGKTDRTFAPQEPLTVGQVIVISARLADLLQGGDGDFGDPAPGEPWYMPAANFLYTRLNTLDSSTYFPLMIMLLEDEIAAESCTRYLFACFLAEVLPEEALTPINHIASLPDIDEPGILALYNAGILTGSDQYGTFRGEEDLNRGQAAAMLARVVDPAQRVSFTPQKLDLAQTLLGLAPDTVVMRIDSYDVTADLYSLCLSGSLSQYAMMHYMDLMDQYPDELLAYLNDDAFTDGFDVYLRDVCGADISIDWDAPDTGGMTPAQKVRSDTQATLTELAVLLNHQNQYPLTDAQRTELDEIAAELTEGLAYLDIRPESVRDAAIAECVRENLTAASVPSAAEISDMLRQEGYLYGLCAELCYGPYEMYDTREEAKETAVSLRSKMAGHLDDPEYLGYLTWTYGSGYDDTPTVIALSDFSEQNRRTLSALSVGAVSAVLEEPDRFVVVVRLDPADDDLIREAAAQIPAEAKIDEWMEAASVTTTPACGAIDIGAAYNALENLDSLFYI